VLRMKLPPSIEDLVACPPAGCTVRTLCEQVAHEACRLQREADRSLMNNHSDAERAYEALCDAPLVVGPHAAKGCGDGPRGATSDGSSPGLPR
jgi:hypothetical protein